MANDFTVTPDLSAGFWHQDWDMTVRKALHDATPDLADVVIPVIQEKTPVLTGTLQGSMSADLDLVPADDSLAFFYANEEDQIGEWGRVYDLYVEGGPLGAPSPTISNPAMMFYSTAEDDIDLFQSWAQDAVDSAASQLAAGQGVLP